MQNGWIAKVFFYILPCIFLFIFFYSDLHQAGYMTAGVYLAVKKKKKKTQNFMEEL